MLTNKPLHPIIEVSNEQDRDSCTERIGFSFKFA